MITRRIVPVLLLSDRKLVKSVGFKDLKYVGDPINVVKIFNDKEVDEIVIFDISRTPKNLPPQYDLLNEIVSEAFIPITYGGGVTTPDQVDRLLQLGIEKISLNTINFNNLNLLKESAAKHGNQALVAVIDVRKKFFGGFEIYNSKSLVSKNILDYAKSLEDAGAGEIVLQFADNDGTYKGFDLQLVEKLSAQLKVPLFVCGGAGNLDHLKQAFKSGASAVGAGSLFVYYGPHKAVLVNYPARSEIKNIIASV